MTKISNQYSLTNILTADLANSRLGINNVSPTVALDVTGAGKFSGNVVLSGSDSRFNGGDSVGRLILSNSNTTTYIALYGATHPTLPYIFSLVVNSSSALAIASTGRATFESTNAKTNTGNWHQTIFDTSTMATGVGGGISFCGNKATSTLGLFAAIDGYKENATSGNELGGFRIWTSNGTNLVERMRITSSGNVGIGNTGNASRALEVTQPTGYSAGIRIIAATGPGDAKIQFFGGGSSQMDIGPTAASPNDLIFGAGGSERMRITSGGQLLIGMSSAVSFRSDSQLQVNNCTILRSNDGYNGNPSAVIYSGNDQSGTMFVEFTSSGFSRIGSITRNGASNVSYNTGSDIRIKKNIIDAPTSLNKLNSIQVRSFDWVEDDAHQDFGFIAQELINVMPIAVTKGAKEKDIWQVDNSKLVPLLVKSIQELSAKVSLLENK